jgi:hypothetical protein
LRFDSDGEERSGGKKLGIRKESVFRWKRETGKKHEKMEEGTEEWRLIFR